MRIGSFNPRPHAEGDFASTFVATYHSGFNPRPHAEGDAIAQGHCSREAFQSTPSRGGRPAGHSFSPNRNVSIHALTRRATTFSCAENLIIYAFQSTPSRGGRPGLCGL